MTNRSDPVRPRITLDDIAEAAGVSRATASRALGDNPRISAGTRASVRGWAERLHYVPNAAARSLRVRRTRTLGLLLADLSDPVHAQVAAGFELEAGEAGYTVIFVAGLNEPIRERRALKVFAEHGTDGVALVSSVLDPAEVTNRTRWDRLVHVQPDHASLRPHRDSLPPGIIQTDDAAGVAMAVDHLVARGYRDIGYVGAGTLPSNRVRREAVADTLRRHGVSRPLHRFQVPVDGWRAPAAVAARIARELPEALVCYDDKLALALLDALRDRGIRVPDDVALVGFDGIPFAEYANPRLTTVVAPTVEMGRLAARALITAIGTGELPPATALPVELAVRESTPPLTAGRRPGDDEPSEATIQLVGATAARRQAAHVAGTVAGGRSRG
jgi:LacI family transcriptional regulator, galactose operon repressor